MENSAWKDVITRLLVAYDSLDRMFNGRDSISALDVANTPARQHCCGLHKNICDAKANILRILADSGAVDELLKRMSEVDKAYGLVAKHKSERMNATSSDGSRKVFVKSYSLSNIADMLLSCYDKSDKVNTEIIKAFKKYFEEIEKNKDKNKGDEKDKKD